MRDAINRCLSDAKAVHYEFSGKKVAGEPGFKEEYTAGIRDTWEYGKRADLLIVPKTAAVSDDISQMPTADTSKIVANSVGALEVRSSRLEARRYTRRPV